MLCCFVLSRVELCCVAAVGGLMCCVVLCVLCGVVLCLGVLLLHRVLWCCVALCCFDSLVGLAVLFHIILLD